MNTNLMKQLAVGLMLLIAVVSQAAEPTKTPVNGYPDFAIGGDMSWTKYIQDNSLYTYNPTSTAQIAGLSASYTAANIAQMAADYGIDAVRLRVWVDPTQDVVKALPKNVQKNYTTAFRYTAEADGVTDRYMSSTLGYGTQDDLLTLATQFANAGLRVMVNFHLSDTWADPGAQFIPTAWASATSIDALTTYASNHVTSVLQMLRDANVNVAWVQIGNETNSGMLKYNLPTNLNINKVSTVTEHALSCRIPFGTSSTLDGTIDASTARFVQVWHACADAAHQVFPEAKTVLHLTKAPLGWTDNETGKYHIPYILKQLQVNGFGFGTKCQVVGLSCYPTLEENDINATANWSYGWSNSLSVMQNIYSTYNIPTIVAETGMNSNYSSSQNASRDYASSVTQCNTDVQQFTIKLFSDLKNNYDTYHCLGFFYWEPEGSNLFDYNLGACHQAVTTAWPSKDTYGSYSGNVVPNTWWETCKTKSSFPSGGLMDYENAPIEPTKETFYLANSGNEWVLADTCRFSTTDGETYFLTGITLPANTQFKVTTEEWGTNYGYSSSTGISIPSLVTLTKGENGNLWSSAKIKPEYAIIWKPATREFEITYAHHVGVAGDWELTDDKLMQAVAPGVYKGSGVTGTSGESQFSQFVVNSNWDYKYGGALALGATNTLTQDWTNWLESDIDPRYAITIDLNAKTVTVKETINVFDVVMGKAKSKLADNEVINENDTHLAKQLVLTDGYPYAENLEIEADAVQYDRAFTTAQLGTWQCLYVPFDIPKADWGFIASENGKYSVLDFVSDKYNSSDELVLEMSYVEDLEENNNVLLANHPYFFKPSNTLTEGNNSLVFNNVTIKNGSYSYKSPMGIMRLKGNYQPVLMNETDEDGWRRYALANGEFRFTTSATYLKPFRAYIVDTSSQMQAKAMKMFIGNYDPTGVEEVKETVSADETLYDLLGRPVTEPASGIYILGNKKVVIK